MQIFSKNKKDEHHVPSEVAQLREAVIHANLPEHADKTAFKELERLAKSNPASAEYTIGINYIDYLVSLPWNRMTDDDLDIGRTASVLEEAHFGLDKIKERILEHLAVRILKMSRQYSILVVDDEKMTRMNLEHVFTKDGYFVRTADSGVKALELLDLYDFDVVVTDLKMEKVDGMNVLERAKEKNPGTAVIIITGYATIPVAVDAMKKGSHHLLAKPFKLEEIRSTTQKALSHKKKRLEPKGPIICFSGPPGTGKTSLGQSIARSLGRKFIRISVAGMKDEAEIRGHRRSYVGALPGRIIQEIRRIGYRNPLIMLDELDKIGQDFRGDPASALLEVLDPEQNAGFTDHYLDMPFDLSQVMFIATTNTVDPVPGPLLDRLELINLPGYIDEEKVRIASDYMIPNAFEDAGLSGVRYSFTPDAVQKVIRDYTREPGLRTLKRQIETICRKLARKALNEDPKQEKDICIDKEMIETFLGPPKYHFEMAGIKDRIGVTTGLAWTEFGGQIIFVEATKMKGNGQLILTGSLGNVMKESAQAALSYIRSHYNLLNIDEAFFEQHDIHIHVPAGAIPKDGPSAGLTIAMSLISLIRDIPARRNVAMTGEITLSGRILPVGGIREKLMAARRAGVTSVILPAKNAVNIEEISPDIRKDLEIVTIESPEDGIGWVLK
ncbi:MAG: endopeptidase La [Desulfobacteraceae bacterium]|nr:endopeptidase La [Desulfobacteraceae bacterium]